MGLIRTLLALSVLLVHAGGIYWLPLPGGMMAVQAFYIISGFYMGLVISKKYQHKKNAYSLFISNRFLRIFPVYWIVLIFSFIVSIFFKIVCENPLMLKAYFDNSIGGFALFYTIIANIIVLGQDVLMFTGLSTSGESFFLTKDFHETSPQLHDFLLIQPSWTIALEFTFYLLAPFLNRIKTFGLIALIAIGFSFRFTFYFNGFYNDPWFYRFFPFELSFFLTGILAYRIYEKWKDRNEIKHLGKAIYIIVIAFIMTSNLLPGPHMVLCYLFYLLIFVSLPFIFSLTKASKVDRTIGELSYPLYICHYPLLELLQSFEFISSFYTPFLLVILSLIFSLLLNKFIAYPIERIRQKRI